MDERRDRGRKADRGDAEEAAERLFNETIRNLLRTPPKPHKPHKEAASQRKKPVVKRRESGR